MIRDTKHIGIIVFASGIVLCFGGILYATIQQLNLHDPQNVESIASVTATTGIGFLLIFVGTNMALRVERVYHWLLLFGSVLSFTAIIIFGMHYPGNWYYPLTGYVVSLYATGILILVGNIYFDSTVGVKKPDEYTIDEEPVPLMYWKPDESARMGVIQNDISNLIVQHENLKESLEDERQNAKSDIKELLLRSLDVLDSFDALFKKIEQKEENVDRQTKKWLGNFRAIRKKLERVLSDSRVSRIESPGGKAIPDVDIVVGTVEREGIDDDTIIEYVERGYAWRGRILRKSSVIVVRNKGGME